MMAFHVIDQPSPNHNARVAGTDVDILLLHYTGMESGQAAIDWLRSPESNVSCHYVVEEDGRIFRLVSEGLRAWHAGAGVWRGRDDINSRSIGIEIVNPGHEWGYRPFPDVQVEAVVALCQDILSRHPISARNVLAHSDIAPSRKIDPGELFPWDQLAGEGIGHWVPQEPLGRPTALANVDDLVRFQNHLAQYGYALAPTGVSDRETATVTAAFQRHFRPARVDGIVDLSTALTLEKLLAALSGGDRIA
ncbi:MAG: N-acetylmuramoyl-L-alanine amidase [Pseudomonadota bacterium]